MSEEKIIQHTKAITHIVKNKEKTWKHKLLEIVQEIAIIVFAVMITLWLHNWNDRRHETEIEKKFLIGVQNNLTHDTVALVSAIQFMNKPIAYYDSVLQQVQTGNINTDYVNNNSNQLLNDLHFISDNGLFESFKSAGNLRLIENQKLSTEMTSLYTSQIPFLQASEQQIFATREAEYSQCIGSKYGMDKNGNCAIAFHLHDPAILFHLRKYSLILKQMNKHRKQLIDDIKATLKDINHELAEKYHVSTSKQDK